MNVSYIVENEYIEKLVEIILNSWMTDSGNISTMDAAQQ